MDLSVDQEWLIVLGCSFTGPDESSSRERVEGLFQLYMLKCVQKNTQIRIIFSGKGIHPTITEGHFFLDIFKERLKEEADYYLSQQKVVPKCLTPDINQLAVCEIQSMSTIENALYSYFIMLKDDLIKIVEERNESYLPGTIKTVTINFSVVTMIFHIARSLILFRQLEEILRLGFRALGYNFKTNSNEEYSFPETLDQVIDLYQNHSYFLPPRDYQLKLTTDIDDRQNSGEEWHSLINGVTSANVNRWGFDKKMVFKTNLNTAEKSLIPIRSFSMQNFFTADKSERFFGVVDSRRFLGPDDPSNTYLNLEFIDSGIIATMSKARITKLIQNESEKNSAWQLYAKILKLGVEQMVEMEKI